MIELKPNILRALFKVGGSIFLVYGIWYLIQRLLGHLPDSSGLKGMVIGVPVLVIFSWFAFVPRRLAFSDYEITISTLLGTYTYRWPMLNAYGPGRGVFMIQFDGDRQAYQILSSAYAKADWKKLTEFLSERFPEKRTSFSFGARLYPKK